jgi:Fe-S cluster biogenesis protein NfuA/nitrite reductase/ring-hydroxylating ferredoxin subunit
MAIAPGDGQHRSGAGQPAPSRTARVTVLDLMADASASVPDSGAAARRVEQAHTGAEGSDDLLARIEALSEELETVQDARARAVAGELMSATLELHGRALERVMELVEEAGPSAAGLRDALVGDGIVASLLLVHGLYPVDLETRVRAALDEVRPYMESHGGDVELLALEDGVARLRLRGSCEGCPASSATLELAIKKALMEAAPDLDGLEVEGAEPDEEPEIGGVPLPLAPAGGSGGPGVPGLSEWRELDGAAELQPGSVALLGGLAVANVAGTLLAYRNACAACGGPLDGGRLDGGVLSCPGCGRGFDLPRAGRPVEPGVPQLGPVPLLRDPDGRVRVALPA